MLAGSQKVPLVSSAVGEQLSEERRQMPGLEGKIGDSRVRVLRDTGCGGIIVKQKFVADGQYTVKHGLMQMMDNTLREIPVAKVHVDSSYLTGEVESLCPPWPDAVDDVIVENVPVARAANFPDKSWHEAGAVTTRLQSRSAGQVAPLLRSPVK